MDQVVTHIIDYCNGSDEDNFAYIMQEYSHNYIEINTVLIDYIKEIFAKYSNIKIDSDIYIDSENYITFKIICNNNEKYVFITIISDDKDCDYWYVMIK